MSKGHADECRNLYYYLSTAVDFNVSDSISEEFFLPLVIKLLCFLNVISLEEVKIIILFSISIGLVVYF